MAAETPVSAPMTYYESAADIRISRARAQFELLEHGTGDSPWIEFLADVGDRDTCDAQEVLDWLGY
jgi:hypothetical protein